MCWYEAGVNLVPVCLETEEGSSSRIRAKAKLEFTVARRRARISRTSRGSNIIENYIKLVNTGGGEGRVI